MDDDEFGGPLPITTAMWYFNTHLHYLKNDKSFKPSFVFIDHQPDLVCKIVSIEPNSRMHLLSVTSDNLSHWFQQSADSVQPCLDKRIKTGRVW